MRDEKFEIRVDDIHPAFKPALQELRRTLIEVRRVREEAPAAWRRLAKDRDLNEQARARKQREHHQDTRAPLEERLASVNRALDEAVLEIERRVAAMTDRPRLAPVPQDATAAEKANAERTEAVARALNRAEVDRLVDRALASGDPIGAILKAHALAAGSSDPLVEETFATHGLERVRAEAPNAAQVIQHAIADLREQRLPKEGKYLLDARDWLEANARTLVAALLGDVRSERFTAEGYSQALSVAPALVGALAE